MLLVGAGKLFVVNATEHLHHKRCDTDVRRKRELARDKLAQQAVLRAISRLVRLAAASAALRNASAIA